MQKFKDGELLLCVRTKGVDSEYVKPGRIYKCQNSKYAHIMKSLELTSWYEKYVVVDNILPGIRVESFVRACSLAKALYGEKIDT